MKTILYLLIAFLTWPQLEAQNTDNPQEVFINETWYFTQLIINGDEYSFVPNNEVEEVIFKLTPEEGSNDYIAKISFCETMYADPLIVVDNSHFRIQAIMDFAYNDCLQSNNIQLDTLYYQFFLNNYQDHMFEYQITEEENFKQLTITGNNGDVAIYQNVSLSVEKNNRQLLVLYPNPTDKYIYLNQIRQPLQIKVYNLSGKLMFSKYLDDSTKKINISQLSEGIYFYILTNSHQLVQTGKIIKK